MAEQAASLKRPRVVDSSSLVVMQTEQSEVVKEPSKSSMPGKRVLFLCLMQNPSAKRPVVYSIREISVEDMIAGLLGEDFKEVYSWGGDEACYGMGCFNLGTGVYFLGGILRYKFPGQLSPYCPTGLSGEVLYIDISPHRASSSCLPPCPVPLEPMNSGKAFPIILELDGKFYVCANICRYFIPKPSFEVYDPCSGEWTPLEVPPFYRTTSVFYTTMIQSQVVVGKKICVTTRRASFAYDTVCGKWEACELFSELNTYILNHISGPPKCFSSCKTPYGKPFPFLGKAYVYDEDILIGIVPALESVAAYQLVEGKAQRMQALPDLHVDNWAYVDNRAYDDLIDLGGGFFCLMTHKYFRPDSGDMIELSLVTFEVSKVSEVVGDQFLRCEAMKPLTRTYYLNEPCIPVGSFTL